jgi:CSLREA domain-containing protein
MRRGLAVVVVTLGVVAGAAAPAQAATFTVNSTADVVGACPSVSSCTLRTAVDTANSAAGNDTITFALPPSSTISLLFGPLIISPANPGEATTISGPGANTLTVQRDPGAPPSPVISADNVVTISGVTIKGGVSGPFTGAAMSFFGPTTTLDGVAVTGNTANAGGGTNGSAVIVSNSNLTLRNSTVSGNTVTDAGTGLSASGLITLDTATIVNSTIADNTTTGTGPAAAIFSFGFSATILNSTIAGNSSGGGTGGLLEASFLPTALSNTILAGNTVAGSPSDCNGTPVSQGYNILGTNTGCPMVAATGDQIGSPGPIDPLLGPLAINGGTTQTRLPLTGSPAINAGNPAAPSNADPPAPPALVPCRTTDQRGFGRPINTRCDIGAVEVGAGTYPTVVLADTPAGYWRFDELSGTTALDSSGNSNNGTYLNGPLLGQTGAFAGSNTAASFDGINDLVRVPDSSSLDVGDTFSLEGWVKRSSTSGSQSLLNKGGNGIQLTVMNAANGNQVWLRKANVTTLARSSAGIPADGRFHYIVATKNGTGAGSLHIYIDGVDSTVVVTGVQAIANTAFPLDISGGASNQHSYDELALYNGVLSAVQVANHYVTAAPAPAMFAATAEAQAAAPAPAGPKTLRQGASGWR